jgi:hypothetical protein
VPTQQSEPEIAVEERLTAFRPYPDVMMKKAQMLALAG